MRLLKYEKWNTIYLVWYLVQWNFSQVLKCWKFKYIKWKYKVINLPNPTSSVFWKEENKTEPKEKKKKN